MQRLDIVIAGAHPADRDLWQGSKPINACGVLAKDGGTLILVTPAREGIAPDHPQLVELEATPQKKAFELLKADMISDEMAAATYLTLVQTRRRVNIIVVTEGFTNEQVTRIGLTATPSIEEALAYALARHGRRARIGVLTKGADIMGVMKGAAERVSLS